MSICVSLSVCNAATPESLEFVVGVQVRLHNIEVKFVYQGHRVKVKVIGAKCVRDWKSILYFIDVCIVIKFSIMHAT